MEGPSKEIHNKKYLETAEIIKNIIIPTFKPNKIEILGGEVTILKKELPIILSEINPNYYGFINFITNGSNLKWFMPLKNRNHWISVSIHESQIDIEDIIRDIKKYKEEGLNLGVNSVLTKYNSEVIKKLKKEFPDIIIKPEQFTPINELDKTLISSLDLYDDRFVGKPCRCKSNMIHIGSDGFITRCNFDKYRILPKHIVEHTKEEIEKAINNVINNPIIDCDSACYPCVPTNIQYHES